MAIPVLLTDFCNMVVAIHCASAKRIPFLQKPERQVFQPAYRPELPDFDTMTVRYLKEAAVDFVRGGWITLSKTTEAFNH